MKTVTFTKEAFKNALSFIERETTNLENFFKPLSSDHIRYTLTFDEQKKDLIKTIIQLCTFILETKTFNKEGDTYLLKCAHATESSIKKVLHYRKKLVDIATGKDNFNRMLLSIIEEKSAQRLSQVIEKMYKDEPNLFVIQSKENLCQWMH